LPSGHLTIEQLQGILEALPVDLTFVDADDRVAFFSEGPDRVFSRTRAILGRRVQHCHPPKSVDVVERILADFRAGTQSVAEFWLELHGRFVHVRYFAVRDAKGAYAGCLEVTQDVTRIRALTGERRLLEYVTAVTA
ncbi:MAG: PAS domain-containing protein, partial [Thermoanaerobaculia bacterium]|nr:PAS domain-containing protein [Thermoanaerobaculia bacterium]